jgi:CRP-like cAMP-binding protein
MNDKFSISNCLLTDLPEDIQSQWQPHMEELDLPEGHVLSEPGEFLSHIYFPSTAILSWQNMLASGDCTEVAMVGREGLLGLFMLMGASTNNNQGIVQTAGKVIRIKVELVLQSFRSQLEVQRRIMLFAQALILQMSQGNVCRQHHTLEQQLSRMLLMILDRQTGLDIHKTHEALALMLGVRREAVSLIASKLMKDGVVSYARGHIKVLNRQGLVERACECYEHLKQQSQPILNCQKSALSIAPTTLPLTQENQPGFCCAL